jgi:hypothetical protein
MRLRALSLLHCICEILLPLMVSQDMSNWSENGRNDGLVTYSGTGKLPSARGDGVIPFPVRCDARPSVLQRTPLPACIRM